MTEGVKLNYLAYNKKFAINTTVTVVYILIVFITLFVMEHH